jgi:cytidine deaminase
MVDNHLLRLTELLIQKRKAQHNASGFKSMTNSNHMCAILKDGAPISYGTNVYATNGCVTEHAEAQALRRLCERMGRNAKKIKIDILVVRTNGSNSKPCNRCVNYMDTLTSKFNINKIYYTDQQEETGIRCIKFSKLLNDEDRHICAYDRNIVRRYHGNPADSLRSKSPQFMNSIHQHGNQQNNQVRCTV